MGLDQLFKVPQVQLESVRAAVVKRGLDPASFQLVAKNNFLAEGPFKTIITVTRGTKSLDFERVFDGKWVDDFKQALERGEFD
jgi:hypothetical protein